MFFSTLVTPQSGRSGKVLATCMVVGGIVLALLAMKFRILEPRTETPATHPVQYGEPEP